MPFEGKKIRGSDNLPNFIIIEDSFYKVTPDLVSFEMVLGKGTENIACIGYSKPLKQIYVQMLNNKSYIYSNISVDLWQKRHNYDKVNVYYATEIKGHSFYETEENVLHITAQYVMDSYSKLEYHYVITCGLFATDRPDLVIDPENVLFQIQP